MHHGLPAATTSQLEPTVIRALEALVIAAVRCAVSRADEDEEAVEERENGTQVWRTRSLQSPPSQPTTAASMGTYLSVPVTEKGKESGANERLNWGVVDMQGWRKSMEDAHVAQPLSFHGRKGQVFGVFDGHGGPEVARFCQLYLVSVLEQQKSENMGEALTSCFHALDRMIDGNDHRYVP